MSVRDQSNTAGLPAVDSNDFGGKGEIPVGTGLEAWAMLPPGANGKVLKTDSSTATGVKWDDETSTSTANLAGIRAYLHGTMGF